MQNIEFCFVSIVKRGYLLLPIIAKRIEQAIGLGKIANLTEKNGFTEGGCQDTYRSYS